MFITIAYCVFLSFIFFPSFGVKISEEFCKINTTLKTDSLNLLSQGILLNLDGKVKGEAGKIGVIGGSIEYTGAPYFAAITSLKVGADLVYVITTESAAPVIKSYSPDLIVYPFLTRSSNNLDKIKSLLTKMDVVVIGPGLGREEETLQIIYNIMNHCKNLGKPLVIDADGLYAISKNISHIKDYPCPGLILTPNEREAKKLEEAVANANNQEWHRFWGDCVSVLVKGEKDEFFTSVPNFNWSSGKGGSVRRAAGQGDILSGALGTFFNWAIRSKLCDIFQHRQLQQSVASYTAAQFTRKCNHLAYQKNGRNMIASDMIREIHGAFEQIYGEFMVK